MSYANSIHLKRLKRKRTLQRRWNAYGSVMNHFSFFGRKRPHIAPKEMVYPIEHRNKEGLFKRFANKIAKIWK